MKKNILIILIILGGLAFGAFNYHFILLDSKLKVLKKTEPTLEYTFVDARGTKKFKLLFIPALLSAGYKDLLEQRTVAGNQAHFEPAPPETAVHHRMKLASQL